MSEWLGIAVTLVVIGMVFGRGWFGFSGDDVVQSLTPGALEQKAAAAAALAEANKNNSQQAEPMKNISTVKGLEIYDEVVGTGAEAVLGKTITVHYIGKLSDGTQFDSSVERGKPFEFSLGTGRVIQGWDLGFTGMKIGGVRKLVISPELAYGTQNVGTIPPNSTLVFEVQLLEVK
jgi:peptidylprolyl isomerase